MVDIGIEAGRIAAIERGLAAESEVLDLGGRLIAPGFVETHIHLDKSGILDRLSSTQGGLDEAIGEVARLKQEFTAEDVYHRAKRTLEKCILNGTTHIRTHLEVDPVIGLRSLEGILPLIEEFKWAMDIEICVFPQEGLQEGLLNNPGTDELMVEGLRRGGKVVGAPSGRFGEPGALPGRSLLCIAGLAGLPLGQSATNAPRWAAAGLIACRVLGLQAILFIWKQVNNHD